MIVENDIELNSNIRCIEMREILDAVNNPEWLNSNIRCIEIFQPCGACYLLLR